MEKLYQEFRCRDCGKLLFKGLLAAGEDKVEIKCRGCGMINKFEGQGKGVMPKLGQPEPPNQEQSGPAKSI